MTVRIPITLKIRRTKTGLRVLCLTPDGDAVDDFTSAKLGAEREAAIKQMKSEQWFLVGEAGEPARWEATPCPPER